MIYLSDISISFLFCLRSRGNSPAKVVPPPRKIFIEEIKDLGYADAYRLDKRKDRDNFTFSSINKKHLSKYRTLSKVIFIFITCDYMSMHVDN